MELFDALHADGFTIVVIMHDPTVAGRAAGRSRSRTGCCPNISSSRPMR